MVKKKRKTSMKALVIPEENIEHKIYVIRGKKVMLDRDLALLYNVETRVLNQAVTRNKERFPEDFMFQLTKEELENWRSQIVMSNSVKMGLRRKPYAFTEPGVAMLSAVLKSDVAVNVSIQIIRTFIKLREMVLSYSELNRKINLMEKKYDHQFKVVFDVIKELVEPAVKPKKKIGFHRS
jgi:hypothetical protein